MNRYVVEEVIGSGGMGSVYRARDLHFPNIKKMVAIKEMAARWRDPGIGSAMLHNFEREANILATLNHPAIPRVYDYFSEGEHAYLVMEFVHGKDLEKIIKDNSQPISEEQVIGWAIELCEVLQHLHTHQPEPIIFRDMKPSNIMINQFNHIVLVDFGIAKAFRSGQRGTVMGTEGYSPPEQYRGEVNLLVDIYALGATLHHLLTRINPQNEPPFTFSERPIHQLNPEVSAGLERVINTALEYSAANRYQSAEEMRQALLQLRGGADQNTRNSSIASPGLLSMSRELLWAFECEDEVRGTPAFDGGVLYVGAYDYNLYALDAANGHLVWKYPTGGSIVGRPVVKDRFVFLGSEDREVHVVHGSTGRLLWNYRTDGMVRSSPRLTDDYLFIGSDDGYLHAIHVSTGRRLWRFQAGAPIRSTPFFNKNMIYFGSEAGDFFCLDLLGESKWHFRSKRAATSSPALLRNMIIFGSMDGVLYAIEAQEGWDVWRFRFGKGTISSPCVTSDFIFIGALDGCIYCIDADNAREVWNYKTGHQVTGSPLIYEDFLFCGSVDGNMYCLDYRSGKLIWKFATGGPITGSPIVIEDVLYFGSTDHKVYAIALA
ncbi:MAG: serine/threonine-protein kinase [Chloroflexi bacterium]|nr:serine/threonine-protein kinase [Chloroflexota bacterium]